jgi:hypothetical protein
MLEIHKTVRQTLMKINRLSTHLRSGLEEDEDFKEALVDIYVVLVKFWVEAIKHIRETRKRAKPSIELTQLVHLRLIGLGRHDERRERTVENHQIES